MSSAKFKFSCRRDIGGKIQLYARDGNLELVDLMGPKLFWKAPFSNARKMISAAKREFEDM